MARFGSKSTVSDWLFNKAILAVLIVLCVFVGKTVYERYRIASDISIGRYEAEEEYQAMLERRDTLLEKVEYLQGDSGRESEIRKHFDVAREGEQVVIIVDEEDGGSAELKPGIAPTAAKPVPWWQFWR